jgi:LPXTG-motif cell wall-anchored protein
VNRVFRLGRRRRRVALLVGIIAAVVVGMALPAWAHHPILSGETECTNGDHVVSWTIENNQTDQAMTIDSATAAMVIGGAEYPVTGYTSPVGNSGTTHATTIVPGNVTGTIELTVDASWPDGITSIKDVSVELVDTCTSTSTTTTTASTTTTTTTVPETTTTTVPETTTTVPETTTTVPQTTTTTVPETTTTVPETTTTVSETTTTVPETTTTTVPETTTTVSETTTTLPETTTTTVPETTTTVPQTTSTDVGGITTIATTTTTTPVTGEGSTVPTVGGQATTAAPTGAAELPRTGSSSGYAVFFGLSCIAGGALLLIRRRSWLK